ncbi:Uncharacterised protein [Vibrio cholerae]|nr:Uncharacterised protein [Vibrio cholerae]
MGGERHMSQFINLLRDLLFMLVRLTKHFTQ